mmetsp:Transcript_55800/g.126807  ORF Transcript_55800/g.126807 Transcript_55800/m.126807 type:complete len:303 (-) Transcript_55800:1231-2139(-)
MPSAFSTAAWNLGPARAECAAAAQRSIGFTPVRPRPLVRGPVPKPGRDSSLAPPPPEPAPSPVPPQPPRPPCPTASASGDPSRRPRTLPRQPRGPGGSTSQASSAAAKASSGPRADAYATSKLTAQTTSTLQVPPPVPPSATPFSPLPPPLRRVPLWPRLLLCLRVRRAVETPKLRRRSGCAPSPSSTPTSSLSATPSSIPGSKSSPIPRAPRMASRSFVRWAVSSAQALSSREATTAETLKPRARGRDACQAESAAASEDSAAVAPRSAGPKGLTHAALSGRRAATAVRTDLASMSSCWDR